MFTTPDPLDGVDGTPTVANPYHYADNDPVNKVDPLGLRPSDDEFEPPEPKDTWPPDPDPLCEALEDFEGFDSESTMRAEIKPPCGFTKKYYKPEIRYDTKAAEVLAADPQGACSEVRL